MVGLEKEVIEHKIMIYPGTKEKKQKKHVQGGDKNREMNVEVAKLTKATLLREAIFPNWIANPVMVKKHNVAYVRWLLWFKKILPYGFLPLPEVDQKLESLQGFRLKCFLDIYKRYHQILMSKEDEENITFHIDHGAFYYTKMSFGLKNMGATY